MNLYRIVIVENDEDEQFFMQESFKESERFNILGIVRNCDALLEWLHAHAEDLPDIILTDLNMPGKNGFDVIHDVISSHSWAHIPVVVTSTSSTRSIMDKCLDAGAVAYMVKPDTFMEYQPYVQRLHQFVDNFCKERDKSE